MNPTVGSFQSKDGTKIYTETWLPDGAAKAVVIIVHGLGEHIGRYHHVAPRFAAAGYAVYGLDHHGHGNSGGDPRTYFDTFDQPLNDLKQYLDRVKAAAARHENFHVRSQLGIAHHLAFALRNQKDLSGLVLSGAPSPLNRRSPPCWSCRWHSRQDRTQNGDLAACALQHFIA